MPWARQVVMRGNINTGRRQPHTGCQVSSVGRSMRINMWRQNAMSPNIHQQSCHHVCSNSVIHISRKFLKDNANTRGHLNQGWTPRPTGQRGCPAPPRKIPLLPSPAPSCPWKWSNCGAFAGQNENSKTLKRPKIFTNAYGQAGG